MNVRARPLGYLSVALLCGTVGSIVACSALLDTDHLDRNACDPASACATDGAPGDAEPASDAAGDDAAPFDASTGTLPASDWQYELTGSTSPTLAGVALDSFGTVLVFGASPVIVEGQNDDLGGATVSIGGSKFPEEYFAGLSSDAQNVIFTGHVNADDGGAHVPQSLYPGSVGDAGDNFLTVSQVPGQSPGAPPYVEVRGWQYDLATTNGNLGATVTREKLLFADAGVDGGFSSTLTLNVGRRLQNGALYLAGSFSGAITLGSGKSYVSVINPSTNLPSLDGLLVRIDPVTSDVQAWVFASAGDDQISGLCDVNESVGIAGSFGNTSTQLSFAGAPIAGLVSSGHSDGFFAVMGDTGPTAGMLTLARDVGGTGTDGLRAIAYLPARNELVVGGRAQMGITIGGNVFDAGTASYFVLLAAFDAASGAPSWANLYPYGNLDSNTAAVRLAAAGASGDVFVGGTFSGALDLGLGPLTSSGRVGFLARVTATGTTTWAASLGTGIHDLLVDGDGGLLVSGTFSEMPLAGDASFAPAPTPSGGEIFLIHFPAP